MPVQIIHKKAIALEQLNTAILLFGEGRDLISVVTLAGAAEEILGKLLKAQGRRNSLDDLSEGAASLFKHLFDEEVGAKRFVSRANHARNALKHFNSADGDTVTVDLVEEAIDMVDRAITNYWRLETALTPAMESFIGQQRQPN